MSTTLYHPNIPGVTRVREDEADIKAHKEAGWLSEDPAQAAEKAAAEEFEKERRSEAAKKAAEKRRKNAAESNAIPNDDTARVTPAVGAE